MAKFDETAVRYMTDLMRDFDLPAFQAAGIVGNGGAESGGFEKVQEINPTVPGSAGGLGHFQWTGRTAKNGRRLAFENWLRKNADKGWTAHTYEANYSMLFRELSGTESAALAALRRTKSLEEATEVFCMKFERPGVIHLASRIRWARRAMEAYRRGGTVPLPPDIPKPVEPKPVEPPLTKKQTGLLAALSAVWVAVSTLVQDHPFFIFAGVFLIILAFVAWRVLRKRG